MDYPPKAQGISINDLMERLKLSRNYIIRNITHCVEHIEEAPSKGARVIYNEYQLRKYLMQKSTFTRQTRRINLEHELQNYIKEHPNDYRIKSHDFEEQFIGKIPDWTKAKRSELPCIPLKSTDFWDFPLIFPKEYTQGDDSPEAPTKTAEICYRDMFKAGAIKIQLGRQKTMFFIPNEHKVDVPPLNQLSRTKYDDRHFFLVPADWKPFYEGHTAQTAPSSTLAKIEITIKADSSEISQALLESTLRKGFQLDHILSHEKGLDDSHMIITYQASVKKDPPKELPVGQQENDASASFNREYEQSLEALYKMEHNE